MKDLLIFTPTDNFTIEGAHFEFLPLGPLYLSAYAKKFGYDVDVLHGKVDEIKSGYKFYGVSTTTPQYSLAKEALKRIKEVQSDAITIIGGPHLSAPSCLEGCKDDGWDYLVVGEGEEALVKILSEKPSTRIIVGTPVKSADDIPLPDWEAIDINKYNFSLGHGERCLTTITSRGCAFNCAFCNAARTSFRPRSSENVLKEMDILVNKYGVDGLMIVDDTMSTNKKRFYEILSGMEKYNLKWRSYGRVNALTDEGLERMARAGCVELAPGIESGSQKILDLVGKGTNVEQNIRFSHACKKVGIRCNAMIMIGLPGESPETVEASRRYMEEAQPDMFGWNIFFPYPDTPIFKDYEAYWKKYITIYPYTWDDALAKATKIKKCFVSTPDLSREQILEKYYEYYELFVEITGFDPRKRGNRKRET